MDDEAIINELVLASTYEELGKIESFADELQQKLHITESDYDRILLCLNEAANNAIIHGNREDPLKQVFIKARYQKQANKLFIEVKDEGEGFDIDTLPDPLNEENLLNEGGRGVFLIRQYAEELHFGNKGTKVTIIFELEN